MQLDDAYIKQLIQEYRNHNSHDVFDEFKDIFITYSKYWLKCYSYKDEDMQQDFALYILKFVENIINNYPLDSDVRFITWVNAVLYYKLCDFSRIQVKDNVIMFSNDIQEFYFSTEDVGTFQWIEIIEKLSNDERNLWLFFHMPQHLKSENLIAIADYIDRPLDEILQLYQESLKIFYDTNEFKDLIYIKMRELDNKIDSVKRKINLNLETSDILIQKLNRLKNRQRKYLQSLKTVDKKHFKIFVKLFGNYDKAYRLYQKIKLHIKKILMQDRMKL